MLDCPFCLPTADDVVLLETPHARVMCDEKPIVVGHLLVAPKMHIGSFLDLPQMVQAHVLLLQQEASRRIRHLFGEVGVYEHGRSAICRFQLPNPGHIHAHFHVLPVSFDILRFIHTDWICEEPPQAILSAEERYLFQEIGDLPERNWAGGRLSVLRHFIRSAIQSEVAQRGVSWFSLSAPPAEHEAAVEQTASLFRSVADARPPQGLIVQGGSEDVNHSVLDALSQLYCKQVTAETRAGGTLADINGPEIVIGSTRSVRDLNDAALLRVYLTSPSNNVNKQQQPTVIGETIRGTWDDFRISIGDLTTDDIVQLIQQAWELRMQ